MSEQQLRSYRLTSMEEPTDEMLHAIMEKVAIAARKSTARVAERIIDIPCHPEFKAEKLVLNGDLEEANCTKDCTKELTERQRVILDITAEDCTITAQKIAEKNIKLGQRTLMKELSDLKKIGALKREGGRKEGIWIIMKTDNDHDK